MWMTQYSVKIAVGPYHSETRAGVIVTSVVNLFVKRVGWQLRTGISVPSACRRNGRIRWIKMTEKNKQNLTRDEILYVTKVLNTDAEMYLDNLLHGDDSKDALKNIETIGKISAKLHAKGRRLINR